MLSEVVEREWDVVVIGAGLGGGTAGRRLVERGASVLFLERGPLQQKDLTNEQADRSVVERQFWSPAIQGTIDGRVQTFENAIGSGVGGSSLFYSATLERPERSDLEHSEARPHPTGGWPIGYDDLAPYFTEAERRFSVRGTPDPLASDRSSLLAPQPLRAVDAVMSETFARCGLHPYQLHVAVRDTDNCLECFGRTCPRGCKMDGRTAGVLPALEHGNCALLDRCLNLTLKGDPHRITSVEFEQGGQRISVRGKRYVLASGGFGSPQLLLASASESWPDGCGNSSGIVGRNLMFHLLESIAIWPGRVMAPSGPAKALTMRDLYHLDGKRLGLLQSSGLDAGYGEILHALRQRYAGTAIGHDGVLRKIANVPVWLALSYLGTAKVYRAVIEDLAYRENRVVFDPRKPDQISFEYKVHRELQERRKYFRKTLSSRVKMPMMFLTTDIELDLSHACGTLRFGTEPRFSVLNSVCRFHDIENLYAADSTFMPTSCGVNPGLLIAANALRVADAVVSDLQGAPRT